MPCTHEFGIINEFDRKAQYNCYEPSICDELVSIDDDIVNLWYFDTLNMICYTNDITKLAKGLNMYGVTIIPPESLYKFIEIAEKKTPLDKREKTDKLIKLITTAIRQDKYMIHYGV